MFSIHDFNQNNEPIVASMSPHYIWPFKFTLNKSSLNPENVFETSLIILYD